MTDSAFGKISEVDVLVTIVLEFLDEVSGLFQMAIVSRLWEILVVRNTDWIWRIRKKHLNFDPSFDETPFSCRRILVNYSIVSRCWKYGGFDRSVRYDGHVDGVNCIALNPSVDQHFMKEGVVSLNNMKEDCDKTSPVLASGGMDGLILLWKKTIPVGDGDTTGEPLACLVGHQGPVSAIGWENENNSILSGSYDHTIKLWDVNTAASSGEGHPIQTWTGSDRILSLYCSNNIVVSGTRDGFVSMIDRRSNNGSFSSFSSGDRCVYSVLTNHNAVIVGTHQGWVSIYDIRKLGSVSRESVPSAIVRHKPHIRPVMAIAISADGKLLASGCKNGDISISNLIERTIINQKEKYIFEDFKHLRDQVLLNRHRNGVRSLTFAPTTTTEAHTNEVLISSGNDSLIKSWNINSVSPQLPGSASWNTNPNFCLIHHSAQVPQVIAKGASLFSASIDGSVMEHPLAFTLA